MPGPNTILTASIVLREIYAIMHQRSNFIANTNRQYDDRFELGGVKGGEQLQVRLPPKYTVRTGNAMSVQNVVDRAVTLPRATVKGVDLNFGQQELALSIQDFSSRILQPAVSQLAASVEQDGLNMYKDVPNFAGAVGAAITYKTFQQVGQYMSEELAPTDNNRSMCQPPQARVDFSDAVKGLFQSADKIEEQYVDGMMGRTGGFNVYENTIVPAHTVGVYGGAPLTNGANQGITGAGNAYAATTALITNGWTATTTVLNKGDIITIAGVNAVHPETKVSLGRLKRFVVTANTVTDGAGNSTITISPAIIAGGAYQNVTNLAATAQAIVVLGASASTYGQALGFHRDAFAFVTARLEDPSQYGAFGAQETFDGLSMRIWRQGNIADGTFPCRVDIAYGYASIYPEWAARHVYLLA